MNKEEFLEARDLGLTFNQIGEVFNLTERQVNYRTKKWGLDYSKKKLLDEHFFSKNTKASHYWAGFLAADGWIEGDRNRVGLALKIEDIGHLEKFKEAVGSSHNICPFMNNTAYRIRFNSEVMVKDLQDIFNITPAKTYTYKMPYIEEDYLLLEFLRGYIDGDGHLHKTNSNRVDLGLCSAQEEFLQEFKDICEVLINRKISQQIVLNINPKGQVFNLRLNLDDSRDLINLLYKNSTNATRLDRKFKVASLVLR
jgi:hypothetical protein